MVLVRGSLGVTTCALRYLRHQRTLNLANHNLHSTLKLSANHLDSAEENWIVFREYFLCYSTSINQRRENGWKGWSMIILGLQLSVKQSGIFTFLSLEGRISNWGFQSIWVSCMSVRFTPQKTCCKNVFSRIKAYWLPWCNGVAMPCKNLCPSYGSRTWNSDDGMSQWHAIIYIQS